MRPKVLSIAAYAAADVDIIAVSQTPAAGGVQALTLTASPVVNDIPRQVAITSAGNDTNRRFAIHGTDHDGRSIMEAIIGANAGASQTVRAFKTVTAIFVDGNTAAAVSAGTTTIVDTNWLPLDSLLNSFECTLVLDIPAGNVGQNVTAQVTANRLGWKGMSPTPPYSAHVASQFDRLFPNLNPIASHDTLAGETAVGVQTGNIIVPVTAIRLRSNAVFTGSPITLTVTQSGHGR